MMRPLSIDFTIEALTLVFVSTIRCELSCASIIYRSGFNLTTAALEARNLVSQFVSSDPIDYVIDSFFAHRACDVLK